MPITVRTARHPLAAPARPAPAPAARRAGGQAPARGEARACLIESFESRILFHLDVQEPIADVTLQVNAPSRTFDLRPVIYDESKGTTIRMNYGSLGNIDVLLLDYAAPLSVANFVNYVENGTYNDTVIHRSEPGRPPNPVPFVIQGGGFRPAGTDISPTGTPTVPNEFSPFRSNLRGTLAYAKLGNDPNSATTEWFISLSNNASILDPQNGGFTVFGRVQGGGMSVADAIAGLARVNATPINSAWNHFPVTRTTDPTLPTLDPNSETGTATSPAVDQMVVLNTATVLSRTAVPVSYAVTSSNPSLVNPVVSGTNVTMNVGTNQVGTATITVTATEQGNPTPVSDTFTVTIVGNSIPAGNGANANTVVFQDADGTTGTVRIRNGTAFLQFSDPGVTVTTTSVGDGRVDVNGITSSVRLRSFVGRGVTLRGTSVFSDGVGRLDVTRAENATVRILRASTTRLPDAAVSIGTAENSSIDSQQPLRSLRVESWSEGPGGDAGDTISAPRINSLVSAGDFAAGVILSGSGVPAGSATLGKARVGSATAGTWNVTGRTSRVSIGSTGPSWFGTFGDLASFSSGGELSGRLTANTIGDLNANKITNLDLDLTRAFAAGAVALNRLNARDAITGTHVRAAAGIGTITAASMSGSTVYAGVGTSNLPDGAPLPADAAAFANAATIRGVTLTRRGTDPAFANSNIAASAMGRLSLGLVQVSNGGTPFGVAAQFIQSLAALDGGTPVLGANLDTPAQNIDRTDFEVRLF